MNGPVSAILIGLIAIAAIIAICAILAPAEAAQPDPVRGICLITGDVIGQPVNVRTEPSTLSSAAGQLPSGQMVVYVPAKSTPRYWWISNGPAGPEGFVPKTQCVRPTAPTAAQAMPAGQ